MPALFSLQYRLATDSSQQRKTRHIHGRVGKAVCVHIYSTPLPFSSIKIHLVKGGIDRSILIHVDESSKVAL